MKSVLTGRPEFQGRIIPRHDMPAVHCGATVVARAQKNPKKQQMKKQDALYATSRGLKKPGDDLLSHKNAVPSALAGLTSVFGMGTGVAPPP